jgi:DNA-binding NarL/FixJ family response regulator
VRTDAQRTASTRTQGFATASVLPNQHPAPGEWSSTAPHGVQAERLNALKVFIVEDAINMQLALRDLVSAVADAEIVGVVASEALAIDWADSHPGRWELAIVDLTLAEGDGFGIVRRLKEQPECGAVVVFSGYVTAVIRRHCYSLGADAVFHKTESRELAQYIEELAARPLAS